jgi:hypothetical protein
VGEESASRPGRYPPPRRNPYPLYRKIVGTQSRSGWRKISSPLGINPLTVRPIVSRYTEWTTLPTWEGEMVGNFVLLLYMFAERKCCYHSVLRSGCVLWHPYRVRAKKFPVVGQCICSGLSLVTCRHWLLPIASFWVFTPVTALFLLPKAPLHFCFLNHSRKNCDPNYI